MNMRRHYTAMSPNLTRLLLYESRWAILRNRLLVSDDEEWRVAQEDAIDIF